MTKSSRARLGATGVARSERSSTALVLGASGLLTCIALLMGASTASAGVPIVVAPNAPMAVRVGDTVASTLTITHANTSAEAGLNDTLNTITLVPSCGDRTVTADCSVHDPDVLVPTGTTGTGRSGTACAGIVFTFTLTDAAMGKYAITWSGSIVLTPTGAAHSCVIDFLTDVGKSPTVDANPAVPGSQTDEKGSAMATATGGLTGTGTGRNEITVLTAVSSMSTQVAPASIVFGAAFHDTATLTTTGGGPAPTGTVRFDVYGPGAPSCTGTPTFTSTNAIVAGTTATSAYFTPTSVGTWKVIATYSGDANYSPLASSCTDPAEAVSVMPAGPPPAIATQASPSVQIGGGTLSDSATVTHLVNPIAGAGTVTFNLYGPDDAACATPILTRSNRPLTLNAPATAASADSGAGFVPLAPGTYRWIASYSGDANNAPTAGSCGDPAESVLVSISHTTPLSPVAVIASPSSGGTYGRGQSVPTSFSCADGASGPGIATCSDSNGASSPTGHLNTSDVGPHTYRAIAVSKDGQAGVASITYTVIALPLLSCQHREIALIDVHTRGKRVLLNGITEPSFAGRQAKIALGSKTVGHATIGATGRFATSLRLPPRKERSRARYHATIDAKTSSALKLQRRAYLTRARLTAGRLMLAGGVTGHFKPGATVRIQRISLCTRKKTIATTHLTRNGTWKLTTTAPSGAQALLFRARITLGAGATYTLPTPATP